MSQVFINCRLYNGTESPVGRIGVNIRREYDRLLGMYNFVERFQNSQQVHPSVLFINDLQGRTIKRPEGDQPVDRPPAEPSTAVNPPLPQITEQETKEIEEESPKQEKFVPEEEPIKPEVTVSQQFNTPQTIPQISQPVQLEKQPEDLHRKQSPTPIVEETKEAEEENQAAPLLIEEPAKASNEATLKEPTEEPVTAKVAVARPEAVEINAPTTKDQMETSIQPTLQTPQNRPFEENPKTKEMDLAPPLEQINAHLEKDFKDESEDSLLNGDSPQKKEAVPEMVPQEDLQSSPPAP